MVGFPAPRQVFSFPNPVNEVSARLVAGGVVVLAAATVAFDQPWLTVPLAYGFVARVLTGPTLSPLGQLSVRVLTPLLGVAPRLVPGPPKRFAQAIGAAFSVTAAVLALGFGLRGAAYIVLGLLMVAATLESVFAICLGCKAFALLMRAGVIPESVCEACNDISRRSLPGSEGQGVEVGRYHDLREGAGVDAFTEVGEHKGHGREPVA